MRVLVFNEAPTTLLGGIWTETRTLIKGLQARGHSVALASDAPLHGLDVDHFFISTARTERSVQELQGALAAFRPEVVHVLFAFVGGVLRYSKALHAHPWVLTCHSVPPHEWSSGVLHHPDWLHYLARAWRIRRPALGGMLVYGLRIPPRIIVHSEVIGTHLRQRFFPKNRISLIPFGYQARPAGFSWPALDDAAQSVPRLLTIAGITHTKGQHDVLSALPSVRQQYPALRYTMLGEVRDASYLAFLKSRIAELGLASSVDFVINASREQVEQALASADLFVQPSHEEGFCLSYMEAAAQVPRLVGTRTGAMAAMSADDPGARVVPVGHPKAIASAILDLLAAHLPPAHMRERDERLAAAFDWSRYFDMHQSVYEAEVERARRRRRTGEN